MAAEAASEICRDIAEDIRAAATLEIQQTRVHSAAGLVSGLRVERGTKPGEWRVLSTHRTPGVPEWQHEGTGLYGPRRRRIRPKRASVLAWQDPASGKWIRAASVRGVRPRRYLTVAAQRVARRSPRLAFSE